MSDTIAAKLVPDQDERLLAALLPFSLYSIFVLNFFGLFLTLGLWLWKRSSSSFIDKHGRNALNIGLNIMSVWLLLVFLGILVVAFFIGQAPEGMQALQDGSFAELFQSSFLGLGLAIVVFFVLSLGSTLLLFVLPLLSGISAWNGEAKEWRFLFRFVKEPKKL